MVDCIVDDREWGFPFDPLYILELDDTGRYVEPCELKKIKLALKKRIHSDIKRDRN